VFFRFDILTVAKLFSAATPISSLPRAYSSREVIIAICVFVSLCLGGVGFFLSKADHIPRLSDNQKRTLLQDAERVRTLMSTIVISYTNGDPATEPLAHDIADVFNRAGIEPVFAFTRPDNADQSGVILCVKDLNKPPLGTEELKGALKEVGIEAKVRPFPNRGFARPEAEKSQLVIWVAPTPL
jgi:hypothetical protein